MKVMIAYFSATGKTQEMASYIAEGVRFGGHEAMVKGVADIRNVEELAGYDGLILGSPTFSLDIPKPVKAFLSSITGVDLEGKMAGAFGSYSHDVGYQHDNHAPAVILDILQNDHKMRPFDLGPFALKEDVVETGEGMRACQDYGRVFGEKLGG